MRKKGAKGKYPYLGQANLVGSALSPTPALKKHSFKTTGTALSYPPPAASWSRIHERIISLMFLGIILRVLRLEVSLRIS
jgi:hypothetical protein